MITHRATQLATRGLSTLSVSLVAVLSLGACGKATDKSATEPTTQTSEDAKPKPPSLRLSDAAAPLGYHLELTIDPDVSTFEGEATIEIEIASETKVLWLNASRLEVSSATLTRDGTATPLTVLPPYSAKSSEDFLGFKLGDLGAPGKVSLHLEYKGKIPEKEFSGLFRQKEDERFYAFTQFESIGARRVFPSFDEPKWKVPFELTLHVRKEHEAFTNTPLLEESEGPSPSWKTLRFAKTKPLPTYLVAVAVGPFDIVDLGRAGRNDTPMRLIVPKGQAEHTSYAKEVTGELLVALEDYFDMAYPYAKLDSVAIPEFFGAMENPGLITYASTLLVTKKENLTRGRKQAYATTATHELAHQWFGDLVTLAWWDDLWLNESFATWLAAKIVTKWKPAWDGEIEAVGHRNRSMKGDSLISARKIRQPIETKDDIFSAFDGISYGKGGAVIAMFESWMGEEKFREAMRGYVREHAWKTTTADDFLAAIEKTVGGGMPEAFSTFLDQPGLPFVTVEMSCEEGPKPKVSLTLSQERFLPEGSEGSAAQTWHLPMCIKVASGRTVSRQCHLLTKATETITLTSNRCPDWIMANADAAGYYRTAYSKPLLAKLLKAGAALDTVERIGVIGDLAAMQSGGKVPVGELMALLPELLNDDSHHIVLSAAKMASSIEDFVPKEMRPNYTRFINKFFGKKAQALSWKSKASDSEGTKELRKALVSLVAHDGEDAKLIEEAKLLAAAWLVDHSTLDVEITSRVLSVAARNGDMALYEKFAAAAADEKDKTFRGNLMVAMGSFRDPELVSKNLKMLTSDDLSLQDMGALLQAPMSDPTVRQQVYDFVIENFEVVSEKLPAMARSYIVFLAVPFCDAEHRDSAQAFFGERLKDIPGGPRALAQATEQIDLCIKQRAAQEPSITAFLSDF